MKSVNDQNNLWLTVDPRLNAIDQRRVRFKRNRLSKDADEVQSQARLPENS